MTETEIDELAMRSYAADGAQVNPMDWGRAFRAGIAALQRRQAEQAAAGFEEFYAAYNKAAPKSIALKKVLYHAWQARAAQEAARVAEFRRRLLELQAEIPADGFGEHLDTRQSGYWVGLDRALLTLDYFFPAERPEGE